jgi:hypothetical protein
LPSSGCVARIHPNVEECRELLHPCFPFDHPAAFAYVTRKLAYKWAGNIEERNPIHTLNTHLPQRILSMWIPGG